MMPVSHRRFWRICGLSLALHASLFAMMQSPWSKLSKPLPPIIATLRQAVQGAAASSSQVNPPAARPERPAVVAERKPAVSENRIISRPVAAQPILSTDAATDKKLATATVPMPSSSAATHAEAPPPTAPVAQAPVRTTQSDPLASYRQRLSEIFAGHQAYPRLAAMRGWEGEVRVRLKVARKGNLVSIALDHSSGFEVLDQSALAMVEAIAALPALPDGVDASEIQIVVPINYKLRKTT